MRPHSRQESARKSIVRADRSSMSARPGSTLRELDSSAEGQHALWGREFRASVSCQPERLPGELKVCGQCMSQQVAELFQAHAATGPRGTVVVPEDHREGWSREFCKLVKRRLSSRLGLSKLAGQAAKTGEAWLLSLPEELPVKGASSYVVPHDDYRLGLRGNLGLRACERIQAGDIIGPYQGQILLTETYNQIKADDPPAGWLETGHRNIEFGWKLDEYAADFELGQSELEQEIMTTLQGQSLVCSAYMYGNVTALINDPRTAPYTNPRDVPIEKVNCQLKVVAIGGWPMLFVIADKDILPGQELLLDYGCQYWQMMREQHATRRLIQKDLAASTATTSQMESMHVLEHAASLVLNRDQGSGIVKASPPAISISDTSEESASSRGPSSDRQPPSTAGRSASKAEHNFASEAMSPILRSPAVDAAELASVAEPPLSPFEGQATTWELVPIPVPVRSGDGGGSHEGTPAVRKRMYKKRASFNACSSQLDARDMSDASPGQPLELPPLMSSSQARPLSAGQHTTYTQFAQLAAPSAPPSTVQSAPQPVASCAQPVAATSPPERGREAASEPMRWRGRRGRTPLQQLLGKRRRCRPGDAEQASLDLSDALAPRKLADVWQQQQQQPRAPGRISADRTSDRQERSDSTPVLNRRLMGLNDAERAAERHVRARFSRSLQPAFCTGMTDAEMQDMAEPECRQQSNDQAAAASGLERVQFLDLTSLPGVDSQPQSPPLSHGFAFSNLLQSAKQYQDECIAKANETSSADTPQGSAPVQRSPAHQASPRHRQQHPPQRSGAQPVLPRRRGLPCSPKQSSAGATPVKSEPHAGADAADRMAEPSVRSPCKPLDCQPSFKASAQPSKRELVALPSQEPLPTHAQVSCHSAQQPGTTSARDPATGCAPPAQAVSQSSQSPRKQHLQQQQQQQPVLQRRLSDSTGLGRPGSDRPAAVQRRLSDPAALRHRSSMDSQAGPPSRRPSLDSSDRASQGQAQLHAHRPLSSSGRPPAASQLSSQRAASPSGVPSAPAVPPQDEAVSPAKSLKSTPRSIAAARLAAADLKPVGRHLTGVQARIGRYTHCSTAQERQLAKGSKPAVPAFVPDKPPLG